MVTPTCRAYAGAAYPIRTCITGDIHGFPLVLGALYHRSLHGFAAVCDGNISTGFRGSRRRGREKMIDTHAVGGTIRGTHWPTEHDPGHALNRRPLLCNHRVALPSCLSSTRLSSAPSGVWGGLSEVARWMEQLVLSL